MTSSPQNTQPQVNPLVERLEKYVVGIVKEVDSEVDPDRLRQYALAVQHDNYYRGIANATPQIDKDTGRVAWTQSRSDGSDDEITVRSINKVRGDGKKFVAVLGSKAPNVKALPDDPKSEADKAAARQADNGAALLAQQWDIETANMKLAQGNWKYGTMFGYVRWVADGERFGYRTVPIEAEREIELEPGMYRCNQCGAEQDQPSLQGGYDAIGMPVQRQVCFSCGSPLSDYDKQPPVTTTTTEVVGEEKFPNGQVCLTLANVLQVRVPFWSTCLEDVPILAYEYEESKPKLLSLYPQLRERLKNAAGKSANQSISETAATSRDQTVSITGSTSKRPGNKLTYTRYWIRPVMFELIEEAEVREMLYANFPTGLKATLVDGMLIDLEEEKMDDHWAVCQSETGEFIYTDAVCRDMIDFQRAYNDALTLGMETLTRNLPLTIVDQSVLDAQRLAQRRQLVGDIVIAKPNPTTPIDKAIAVVPSANLPKELDGFVAGMEAASREATGVRPEIFGGGEGATATEFTRRSNAALAQLGMHWMYMRRFWVQAYTLGVKELAKYATEDMKVVRNGKGGQEVDVIDRELLAAGNFHFESDEAIPQNWGQQRDQLTFIMGQAPDFARTLGIDHPQNADAIKTLLGLSMLESPGANERDKVYEDIELLLQEKPIPTIDGGLLPSIDPDELDDHAVVFEIVRGWLVSETGRREKKRNPDGCANVRAYALALRSLAEAAMMPPPGGDLPPGEGVPPPPPPGPLTPPGVPKNPMLEGAFAEAA